MVSVVARSLGLGFNIDFITARHSLGCRSPRGCKVKTVVRNVCLRYIMSGSREGCSNYGKRLGREHRKDLNLSLLSMAVLRAVRWTSSKLAR